MRKVFWYFVDCCNAIGTALMGIVATNPVFLILFAPFFALMIPIMIYICEKQRRNEPIDYSW
jgi:hypothetical protein